VTELRTQRLLLRQWRDEDLEPFAKLNADAEVMRYFPAPLSREESDAMVTRVRTRIVQRGWGLWAVEIVGEAAFIGFVGLTDVRFEAHFTPAIEIGWRLAPEFWGNGYATEAARAALAYGFTEVGLEEVVSFTAVVNQPSQRVMRRIGMIRDPSDDFDRETITDPGLRAHVLFRVSRESWKSGGAE
jgi:RimJ/RimL family protein N-acetyltransferase